MHVATTDRRPQEIAEEILLALAGRGDVIFDPAQVREAVVEHAPASRVHVSGAGRVRRRRRPRPGGDRASSWSATPPPACSSSTPPP